MTRFGIITHDWDVIGHKHTVADPVRCASLEHALKVARDFIRSNLGPTVEIVTLDEQDRVMITITKLFSSRKPIKAKKNYWKKHCQKAKAYCNAP